jgi:hypothetical protein
MTPDQLQRTIDDLIVTLTQLRAETRDLDTLATDRTRNSEAPHVAGGDRDYALDNRGDPQAQQLYDDLAVHVTAAAKALHADWVGIGRYFDRGGKASRRIRSAGASADEVAAAITAAVRRRQRGEYAPHLRVAQPQPATQTDWRTECEALRRATAKVTRAFADLHQHCEQTDDQGRKRKLRRRYDLSILSGRERDAWSRAVQSVAASPDSASA